MTVTIDGTAGITTPSPVVVQGSTSGSITLAAPATGGTNTQTLVDTTGTLAPIVSGTVVPYTSATNAGTTIDFTIPSWVKRITVMFNGVSLSSTGLLIIQLGTASGIENTGYSGAMVNAGSTNIVAGSNMSSGFALFQTGGNTVVTNGHAVLCNLTGNVWTESAVIGRSDSTFVGLSGGVKSLGGALTTVRITSSSTDTFDAGSINILYE